MCTIKLAQYDIVFIILKEKKLYLKSSEWLRAQLEIRYNFCAFVGILDFTK